MRFRPNRRASTDHAPGPIIASAAPNAANTICMEALLKWNKRRDSSATHMNRPAIGVQRPRINSAEQVAAQNCKVTDRGSAGANGPAKNCTSGTAATARKNTKPVPGQPSGNVEKSRCTRDPVFRLQRCERRRNPKKQIGRTPLSRCLRCLKIDDAALEPYRNGVSPVVGAKFRKNVLNVTLYGLFGDGELSSDLLVGVAARNQP